MNQFQSIGDVISALKRRFWVIVIVTALGCVASLWFALGMVPTYQATAVVQIEDGQVPDQLVGNAAQRNDASRKVRLIEQRLMARDNLIEIMDRHQLFANDPSVTLNERVFLMRQAARIEEIVNPVQAFTANGNAPSGLRIHVLLDDPQKAADVANDLMTIVIEQSRNRSEGQARETLEFFVSEETRILTEIERMDTLIADFKRANSEQLPAGVSDLRDQLSSLRDTDLSLDREILTLQNTTSRIREDEKTRQIDALQEQKALIAQRQADIQEMIAGSPDVERDLKRLERELTQYQDQYSVITRRKADAEVGQQLEDRKQTDQFEVLETALTPEFPISRSRSKTAIMGGVASGILAVLVAFVLELANPAIRSAAQMERTLGMQPVVTIPVISTAQDNRRRGLKIGALVAASAAVLWALSRIAENSGSIGEAIGRFLPFARG